MENKCNKTPNKYLDHVYCHSGDKNYIRSNNASGHGGGGSGVTGQDVIALLKENKQLKTMLILHMDLIQEQSDQLLAKDRVLNSLREESDSLKTKKLQLESQVQELQKQLQRQMQRVVAAGGEVSTLPPPPLAKIQCKLELENVLQQQQLLAADENKQPKDGTITPKDSPEKGGSKGLRKNFKIQENKRNANTGKQKMTTSTRKASNIIGECNGKLISKIILHRVNTAGMHSPMSSTTSESASEMEESSSNSTTKLQPKENIEKKMFADKNTTLFDVDTEWYETEQCFDEMPLDKRRKIAAACTASAVKELKNNQAMPSRGGKQMPLMLTHAPELHSDESISCDSIAEAEQCTTNVSSPALSLSPKGVAKQQQQQHTHKLALTATQHHHQQQHYAKSRRCGYISTPQRYSTRAWEDEEFNNCDYDDNIGGSALQPNVPPTLEIPKWTEHEISVSYCIEGTEDLSDDTFHKRHAKLEMDEKRRKKWDVQQIREQRRIENLKRRHCKDEVQNAAENQTILSFYPRVDSMQMICYVNDLPVQAFGELIPKLSANCEFMLPWLEAAPNLASSNSLNFNTVEILTAPKVMSSSTSSLSAQQQIMNSSFVLLKKRRRQQSLSGSTVNTRQRQAATSAAKNVGGTAAISTALAPLSQSPTTTTTMTMSTISPIPPNCADASKN